MADDTITCLLCGRAFRFLPTHLARAHGVSADEYRRQFDLPAGMPLASASYRQAHADKIRRMVADGRLTYDHLPQATERARTAERTPKTAADMERQRERIQQVRPWEASQLPPGARRADGRDADRAREYQREYRNRKPPK